MPYTRVVTTITLFIKKDKKKLNNINENVKQALSIVKF